jgi:hypothetical protein
MRMTMTDLAEQVNARPEGGSNRHAAALLPRAHYLTRLRG